MAAKWVGFAVFVYVIGLIVAYVSIGANVFSWTNMTEQVQGVAYYSVATAQEDWGAFTFAAAPFAYFKNLWAVMTLDLPVFQEGAWKILRWVILAPIIATMIYGMVVTFFSMFRRTV